MNPVAQLVTDIEAFLAEEQVSAERFGLIVCGDADLLPKLQRRNYIPPDMEIGIRVVMDDWLAYDGEIRRARRESNQRWRAMMGEETKRDAVRRRAQTMKPSQIAAETMIPMKTVQAYYNDFHWGAK